MHPELGNMEFETAEYIEKRLHSLGIETKRMLGTAVIGYLKGNSPVGNNYDVNEKTVALRADMDALPIKENTGCDFMSLNDGVMHACGHDVHMSAALGAARLLSNHKNELCGSVIFIFQPDEEGNGGAKRLIDAGVLDGADAVFGAHVSPDIPLGKAGIRYGKFYAASDVFEINVHGRSSHGAEPEKGIDALLAASHLAIELHDLTKECLPDKTVLTTGIFNSGTACNILPGEAYLNGIIRTLGKDNRAHIKSRLRETVSDTDRRFGTHSEVFIKESYPGVVNTDAETYHAEKTIRALLGDNNTVLIDTPTMTTEDFGYYIEKTKGCFYHLGAGCDKPLHNDMFLPDESVPVLGAAVHAAVIAGYLNNRD